MKAIEYLFVIFQLFILISGLAMYGWISLLGTLPLLAVLNIGVKLYNMYRMEPIERQQYQEEGGSGIWC